MLYEVGESINLPASGVTPGSYTSTNLTVDAQGRLTAAANGGLATDSIWDAKGDLYVLDWNFLGRITKLKKVA